VKGCDADFVIGCGQTEAEAFEAVSCRLDAVAG
jgi:hypothetical protein